MRIEKKRTEKYEENYLAAMNSDDDEDDEPTKAMLLLGICGYNGRDAFDTDLPNMSATLRIYYTKN